MIANRHLILFADRQSTLCYSFIVPYYIESVIETVQTQTHIFLPCLDQFAGRAYRALYKLKTPTDIIVLAKQIF